MKVPQAALFGCCMLLACAADDAVPAEQSEDLTEAVTRKAVNEPLTSAEQKKLVCDAIRKSQGNAVAASCPGFKYTVTEIATSNKYKHANGKSLTMQMRVKAGTSNGPLYEALLTRQLLPSFVLEFSAEVALTDLNAIHDFLLQLAEDAGEYGNWQDPAVAPYLQPSTVAAMSDKARAACKKAVADRDAELKQQGAQNEAQHGEENFAVVKANATVGFVCNIDDYVDHPLWDGSGVHVYLDVYGTIVTKVDWTG